MGRQRGLGVQVVGQDDGYGCRRMRVKKEIKRRRVGQGKTYTETNDIAVGGVVRVL
jgi:hypothetical protein